MRGVSAAEIAPRVRACDQARAAHRAGAQAARPALRRPAAARGHRARHRHRAAADPDGRAAVESRCEAADRDARRDPPHSPRAGPRDDLRHPRPGRGAVARRSHRRDEGRRRAADRRRRRKSTGSRRTCTSRGSWAIATCSSSTSQARRAIASRSKAPDIGLTGVRKQPLKGRRAAVAIRPEEIVVGEGPGGVNTIIGARGQRRIRRPRFAARRRYASGTGCMCAPPATSRSATRCTCTFRPSACSCIRASSAAMATATAHARSRAVRPHAAARRAGGAFMLLLFVYPFLYGLVLSFEPKEGGAARQLQAFLHDRQPVADDLDDAEARAAGDADQRRLRAADRLQDARQVALPALGDDDAGRADHARHRADRRRHADLFRPEGLAVAVPAILPSVRRSDPPHAQLLGRADLAGHLGISRSRSC